MSGYLVRISYKVKGADRTAVIGVDKGMLPEPTIIIETFTKNRLTKGEVITNVSATVRTRP